MSMSFANKTADITNYGDDQKQNLSPYHPNNHRYYTSKHDRIAIVGAGVAGIAMASALHNANFDNVIVFEKQCNLGGLWLQNYPDISVQTSPHQYEYPGYPYPDHIRNRSNPPCPTGEEVREYLNNFCVSEKIIDKFQFNTIVTKISKNHSTGIWTLTTTVTDPETKKSTIAVELFALVIICTGLFSSSPNILNIPGLNEFVKLGGGKVMHTSQWKDMEEFRNQNVIVIGNGKSAADAAIGAAKMANISNESSSKIKNRLIRPPIQCIRKQHWYIPRCILRFKWIFHSRFVALFLPRYYEDTSLLSYMLHFITRPIKYILWRLLEILFFILLRLPYKVWPQFCTIETSALSVALLVTDDRHLRLIRTGEIDMRITQVTKLFSNKQAQLLNGDIVPVDVVVMGTGWKLDCSFLDNDTVRSKLDIETDGLWLYRNILAPNLPGIAFIGSNTETFMNIYTSYIQAYWLVHLISGNRQPISVDDMNMCIHREKLFKRKYYPMGPIRGACIESYMQQYHDLLLSEQGIDPYIYNRSRSLFAPLYNMFWPTLPETVSESFDMIRDQLYSSTKKI